MEDRSRQPVASSFGISYLESDILPVAAVREALRSDIYLVLIETNRRGAAK